MPILHAATAPPVELVPRLERTDSAPGYRLATETEKPILSAVDSLDEHPDFKYKPKIDPEALDDFVKDPVKGCQKLGFYIRMKSLINGLETQLERLNLIRVTLLTKEDGWINFFEVAASNGQVPVHRLRPYADKTEWTTWVGFNSDFFKRLVFHLPFDKKDDFVSEVEVSCKNPNGVMGVQAGLEPDSILLEDLMYKAYPQFTDSLLTAPQLWKSGEQELRGIQPTSHREGIYLVHRFIWSSPDGRAANFNNLYFPWTGFCWGPRARAEVINTSVFNSFEYAQTIRFSPEEWSNKLTITPLKK